MCLAIPGRVIQIDEQNQKALIDYNGLRKTASSMLVPNVLVDDYVIVHAGFIIQIIDEDYGKEVSQLTEELGIG